MTVYEQELRKLFEHSDLVDRPQFSGRVCVGDLGKDLRVRAEFLSTHISSQYDAIRLTVLNRTEGVVDRTLLRFQDVWGKKQVPNNPNFRSGVIPHLWDDYGKVEWYAYHPTAADYAALRDAVGQYLSAFRERTPELERSGPKLVYICAPLRGDVANNVEFARQKAQEVFAEGNIPICPHLLFPPVADPDDPAQDEKARAMGLRLLESCQQMNVYGPVWTDGMWQEIYTHCCPSSVQDTFSRGLYQRDALTDFFDEIQERCKFRYWFFGHYHENMVVERRFVMLYEQMLRLK